MQMGFLFQMFSNDGQFKSRFGVRGRTPGQLQRPTGVAVHPNGDIIIADYDNKWVSIFSSEGKFKVQYAQTSLFFYFLFQWDNMSWRLTAFRHFINIEIKEHLLCLGFYVYDENKNSWRCMHHRMHVSPFRIRSALGSLWDLKAWLWTKMDTSLWSTTKPAASSSFRSTGS